MAFGNGPRIVTDGLVLSLDAGDRNSYVSGSTVWRDLISSNVSGSLSNTGYSSLNAGEILYDPAVSSSCSVSCNIPSLTQITVNIWYYSNTPNGTALVRSLNNAFLLHYNGAGFYLAANDGTVSGYLDYNPNPLSLRWLMITGTWDGSVIKLYLNGNKQTDELAFTGGTTNSLRAISLIQLGYYFNSGQPYTNGRVSNFSLYNRALTPQEILQNYNSQKSRFNL